MSRYYFAYGSNMNAARMAARGLSVERSLAGYIDGLALAFNKRASDAPHRSYANVVYSPKGRVEGVLYELSRGAEIFKMDPFEGTPRLYSRDIYMVSTDEGVIPAWVYVANSAMITENLMPARWYLEHLLAGQKYLSDNYFKLLQTVPCLDEPLEPKRW